jgi:hypothetical protein
MPLIKSLAAAGDKVAFCNRFAALCFYLMMISCVFTTGGENEQVLGAIVRFDSVYVMHSLVVVEVSSKNVFCNEEMFHDLIVAQGSMVSWAEYSYVPGGIDGSSSVPHRIRGTAVVGNAFHGCSIASGAAEFSVAFSDVPWKRVKQFTTAQTWNQNIDPQGVIHAVFGAIFPSAGLNSTGESIEDFSATQTCTIHESSRYTGDYRVGWHGQQHFTIADNW